MKVAYIDDIRQLFGVQPICDVLAETDAPIAPSTYYAYHTRAPSARSGREEELTDEIRRIHAANYAVYGARKVHACPGARRLHGGPTHGRTPHAPGRITRGGPGQEPAHHPPRPETDRPADLVERQFTATAPNQLWVADITYTRPAPWSEERPMDCITPDARLNRGPSPKTIRT